jgi:hypothetical protein
MPRNAEWTEQLPAALDELRKFPAPVVDRAVLERVLRIGRRTAIRLMNRFGGFQSGKTFLIDRLQLIAQLEQLDRGDDVTAERERRTRLADELEKTRRLAPGRKVRIDTAADVRERVLADLPAGIHLRRASDRILRRRGFIAAPVRTVAGDGERFWEVSEGRRGSEDAPGSPTESPLSCPQRPHIGFDRLDCPFEINHERKCGLSRSVEQADHFLTTIYQLDIRADHYQAGTG